MQPTTSRASTAVIVAAEGSLPETKAQELQCWERIWGKEHGAGADFKARQTLDAGPSQPALHKGMMKEPMLSKGQLRAGERQHHSSRRAVGLTVFISGLALHKGVVEGPLPAGCHGICPNTSKESPMHWADTPELGRMRGLSPAFRSKSKICPFSFFVSVPAIWALCVARPATLLSTAMGVRRGKEAGVNVHCKTRALWPVPGLDVLFSHRTADLCSTS